MLATGPDTDTGPLVCYASYVIMSTNHEIAYGQIRKRASTMSMLTIIQQSTSAHLALFSEVILFRNLVFAPISEEVVFRALMVPALYTGYCFDKIESPVRWDSMWWLAMLCPAWFGLAHAHHLLEKLRQGSSIFSAVVTTLIQFTYTFIFGAIAVLFLLRTGNIVSPIVSHVICNFMGLPDVSFMSANDGGQYSFLYRLRIPLLLLHAGGLVMFGTCLFPMTAHLQRYSFFMG
jgi:membrane protease YdiL (CAAX protease family)